MWVDYLIEGAWILAKIIAIVLPLILGVAYATYAERKVIGYMQLMHALRRLCATEIRQGRFRSHDAQPCGGSGMDVCVDVQCIGASLAMQCSAWRL